MKRNPKSAKPKAEAIQVWTLTQAQSAVSYITSIVRSLREYALDIQKYKLVLDKMHQLSGRPKRDTLIALAGECAVPRSATLAVGDGANDLPMLLAAGLGIAFHAQRAREIRADRRDERRVGLARPFRVARSAADGAQERATCRRAAWEHRGGEERPRRVQRAVRVARPFVVVPERRRQRDLIR